jgi:hypothetical protein
LEVEMPIEREVMRSCLLEAMRRTPRTQFENLKYKAAEVAVERGLEVDHAMGNQVMLERADFRRLRETIWALISEGVMVVGADDSNESWPWVSLTEYGEHYVRDQRVTPHDRSAYMTKIREIAELDDIEERYVGQALEAFARNLPDAAAVMIGAASEHLLVLAVSDIADKDASAPPEVRQALDGPALGMLKVARAYFLQRQAQLPRDLRETLETNFLGIAALVRAARNDGGHPDLPSVDRERSFVALQLFPDYRAWLLRARDRLPH